MRLHKFLVKNFRNFVFLVTSSSAVFISGLSSEAGVFKLWTGNQTQIGCIQGKHQIAVSNVLSESEILII